MNSWQMMGRVSRVLWNLGTPSWSAQPGGLLGLCLSELSMVTMLTVFAVENVRTECDAARLPCCEQLAGTGKPGSLGSQGCHHQTCVNSTDKLVPAFK